MAFLHFVTLCTRLSLETQLLLLYNDIIQPSMAWLVYNIRGLYNMQAHTLNFFVKLEALRK